jgi:hypothetical protein
VGTLVDMLRTTSHETLLTGKGAAIARSWLFMPEVDSSKLLHLRYSHVAALLP